MATYYKLLFPWQHDVTLSSHTQAVLGAEETSYDQYKAFKLFESFPEVGIPPTYLTLPMLNNVVV